MRYCLLLFLVCSCTLAPKKTIIQFSVPPQSLSQRDAELAQVLGKYSDGMDYEVLDAQKRLQPTNNPTEMRLNAHKQFLEDFVADNEERMTAHFTEDAVLRIPGMPQAQGRQEILACLKKFRAEFSNLTMQPVRLYVSPPTLKLQEDKNRFFVQEWVLHATYKKPRLGLSAAGNNVKIRGLLMAQQNLDGRFRDVTCYMGTAKRVDKATALSPTDTPTSILISLPLDSFSEEDTEKINLVQQVYHRQDKCLHGEALTTLAQEIPEGDLVDSIAWEGKENPLIAAYWNQVITSFPNTRLLVRHIFPSLNTVLVAYELQTTRQDTQQTVVEPGFSIHRVTARQGTWKIEQSWSYIDRVHLQMQLRIGEKTPPRKKKGK